MLDGREVGERLETPINPYSLLEAVNRSSDTAHTAWLIFLGLMAYLMIAVAGVTHRDLLLETPVALPLLQVSVPQSQFFQFAPILLVLFHIGVVSQLVLLARKTLELDRAVTALESSSLRAHPLRLELDNFFFVQAMAGPQRSHVMSAFLHGMSWLTLVLLPVILLLFIQIRYLPFHDEAVTSAHRVALLADISMLLLIGIFLTRAEPSFPLAFWRTSRDHPVTFAGTAVLLAIIGFFSLFVATIPGETLDRLALSTGLVQRPQMTGATTRGRSVVAPSIMGFALPFATARTDGTLFGVFHRNIVATDLDLASSKDGKDAVLVLRGRDLRYAKLDRTDLHGADMTSADLFGASLTGANLADARLQCADLSGLYLTDDRASALCASARSANFSRANLKGAVLAGIDARGATFDEAAMDGANFSYGLLTGASFANAQLQRADFSGGAQLQGANFLLTSLQGADFGGASLPLADFSSSQMQAVNFRQADLYGALMRDSDLEGTDLSYAKLEGADLARARVTAADLRSARVWMTVPPADDLLGLADFALVTVKPSDADELARLVGQVDRIQEPERTRIRDGLAPLLDGSNARRWAQSPEAQKWASLQGAGSAAQLTEYLSRLACKTRWAAGNVATGIARRALAEGFRGDISIIYDRMRTKDCPASETASRKLLRDLGNQVDSLKNN